MVVRVEGLCFAQKCGVVVIVVAVVVALQRSNNVVIAAFDIVIDFNLAPRFLR